MYDTLLIPTDGSEGTTKTLDHALELALRYDADIEALAVIDERQLEGLRDEQRYKTERALRENCERAVEGVVSYTADKDITVGTGLESGIPAERILAWADARSADVIVMGTHGHTDHERIATVGSVTQRVVENADVPVFVVHID